MVDPLVLGYDASCSACSRASVRIRELSGGDVSVKPLQSLHSLRVRAFGEDPPWAPTLLEVKSEEGVRGWTGLQMGPRLTRQIGVKRAASVLKIVAEEFANGDPMARRNRQIGRRSALTGISGAIVGLLFLSGMKSATSATSTTNGRKPLNHSVAHGEQNQRFETLLNSTDARTAFSNTLSHDGPEVLSWDDVASICRDRDSWWNPDEDGDYPLDKTWVVGFSVAGATRHCPLLTIAPIFSTEYTLNLA